MRHREECLRSFDRLSSKVQADISEAFLKDPDIRKRIEAFAKLPGNVAQERLHKIIIEFINAIPFADAVHVNLFSSALSHHSPITSDPFISDVFKQINSEIVDRNAETYYE